MTQDRNSNRKRISRKKFLSVGASAGLGLSFMGASLLPYQSKPASQLSSLAPADDLVTSRYEELQLQQAYSGGRVHHPAPLAHVKLRRTAQTERRNVVIIHLESTRARSVTPYNNKIKTTPFLDELARKSLFAERAYTIVPHTSKAIVAVNTGADPHLSVENTETLPGGLPNRGIAELLNEQGYHSVFFQSATQDFENRTQAVKNFGYKEFYPLESMSTKGFQQANYFGFEDDIMLEPSHRWLTTASQQWLKENGGNPFIAMYLTVTPHHQYLAPTRYGRHHYVGAPLNSYDGNHLLNHYLNSVHYVDFFVRNIFEQYKRMGLYEDTIFVLYGDHGEGFGEHGLYQHDDTIYEEGLKIPLIIHDPKRFTQGVRIKGLANETDIIPTLLDLLKFEVVDGKYPGHSLLSLPKDRTLHFSAYHDYNSLASIWGRHKYIYFFDNRPPELYDLAKDTMERHNLAGNLSRQATDKLRSQLLGWLSNTNSMYN